MNLHKMKVRVRKIFFRVRTALHRTTQINFFSARHRTALGAEGARGCAGAEMMISITYQKELFLLLTEKMERFHK